MKFQHRGFTLIELIVVLVLIGVLAVSVVPRFFDTSGTSEYLYRDQALNILRRVQMQAMQCTTSCSTTGVTVPGRNPVRPDSGWLYAGIDNCAGSNASYLCIKPSESNVYFDKVGFNVQLSFDNQGRPSCNGGSCTITINGAVNLDICIEAEGYIHPC
jgi:MSHA pilin protein MshC